MSKNVEVDIDRDNESPVLQTDQRLKEIDAKAGDYISRFGCLYRSLQFLVETKHETFLTPQEIIDLYHRAVEYNLMEENCRVKDHRGILREVQRAFGVDENAQYLYRSGSFDNGGSPNAFILEIDTEVENYNHFLVARDKDSDETLWDPYFPYMKKLGIISRRRYRV